jgi:hypothetical protein
MKQERDEAVEKQKFVQNSVKSTKDMIRRNWREFQPKHHSTRPFSEEHKTICFYQAGERYQRAHLQQEDEDPSSDYKDGEDFKKGIDPAGHSVTRFSNGHVAMNPNNKAQNGELIAIITMMMIMILLMIIDVI